VMLDFIGVNNGTTQIMSIQDASGVIVRNFPLENSIL